MTDRRFVIEVFRRQWGWQAQVKDLEADLWVYTGEVRETKDQAKGDARAWFESYGHRLAQAPGSKIGRIGGGA